MKRAKTACRVLAVVGALALSGCGKGGPPAAKGADAAHGAAPGAAVGQMDLCDFKAGPESAPVKVVAFYPGRHEDTLAAIKALPPKFPGQVSIQIVDWRTKEGAAARDQAGLSCAGITINGKNAVDLVIDGKSEKVMFIRGMDGDWNEAQLLAAIEAEIAATGKAKP